MKSDKCVDMMEMKPYGQIDVNDTPIVVLGCGHFYTIETLDGCMSLNDVYETNMDATITALKDLSAEMATKLPKCPDCNQRVRQYATQRYNRLINRAVIDEMSKRFIVHGQTKLQELDQRIDQMQSELEQSRPEITDQIRKSTNASGRGASTGNSGILPCIRDRCERTKKLFKDIVSFTQAFADRHQPAQKLHEATLHATKRSESLEDTLGALSLTSAVPPIRHDQRITLGGDMIQIKHACMVVEDQLSICGNVQSDERPEFPGDFSPFQAVPRSLKACKKLIIQCKEAHLPKLAVEATLYFARMARAFEVSNLTPAEREKARRYHDESQALLEDAKNLCMGSFQNVDNLRIAVDESIKLLRREWYEEVSAEELAAIKAAMVSGRGGIATHSGHWYHCANGHPVSSTVFRVPFSLQKVR